MRIFRRNRTSLHLLAAAGLAVAGAAATVPSAAADTGTTGTVVASGLNNPRGLAFGPDHKLYVAEAGTGGATCLAAGPEGESCFGATGSVGRLDGDHVTEVVTGLVSIADKNGIAAEGPVAVSARNQGDLYVQFGENTQGVPLDTLPAAVKDVARAQLGQLARLTTGGTLTTVAGVGDFDYQWTKEHKNLVPEQFPDANPNGVLARSGHQWVVDAGANTLTEVDANGRMRQRTFFSTPAGSPTDAVPTCVAKGPDSALYVGELLGGYYAPGHARVWRVVPGHAPTVWQTGFTTINGCGFDRAGNFYATELQTGGLGADSPAGALVKVARDGTRTTLGEGQLFAPSGFAAGRDGAVYVSNWSIMPGSNHGGPTGQVVRFGG